VKRKKLLFVKVGFLIKRSHVVCRHFLSLSLSLSLSPHTHTCNKEDRIIAGFKFPKRVEISRECFRLLICKCLLLHVSP
jgi:hypothetical protein